MASVLAAGPGAGLSHVDAARLWGIWRASRGSDVVHVVSATPRRNVPGVRVHRARNLSRSDITSRAGIPVTTVSRTLLDLGDMLTPYQLAYVIHEADFRNWLDVEQLQELIASHSGRAAVTTLARALDLNASGSAGTRSFLEDRFLAMLDRRGIAPPLVNVQVELPDGPSIEVDMVWPAARVVVEVDGPGHDRAPSRARDQARDARLASAGWHVIRCRSGAFSAAVRQLLAQL